MKIKNLEQKLLPDTAKSASKGGWGLKVILYVKTNQNLFDGQALTENC